MTDIEQRRILHTEIPGPLSRERHARRQREVPSGFGVTLPIFVERAGGGIVVDVDGNHLVDLGCGIAVTSVGASDPRVVERVREQAGRFTHTCFMVTEYDGFVEVAAALNRLTPGDHEKRTALFTTGAEAVENAVKISRAYTGRPAVVVFDHAYHGRTSLTMAMTAKQMPYKHSFGPFSPEIYRVPTADPFRGAPAEEAYARFADVLRTQIGVDRVAAVAAEPIAGEGGFVVPAEGFLPRVAEFCRANGIVFVADEVQTGLARTGRMFAVEHEGVVPDLVCTAKALGGGLPLSAVTGRAEIMDSVHVGGLGGTYAGNPIACAAALGALESIERDDLAGRAAEIGARVLPRLRELAGSVPAVGDVRGRGAMLALEFIEPHGGEPGDKTPSPTTAAAVAKYCHERGVLVLTCGTYSNVIRLLPPLVIDFELLDDAMDVLAEAVRKVAG